MNLLLYDGECALCSASVQFVLQHDPEGQFRFASLQSELGQQHLQHHQIDRHTIDSLVLIEASGACFLRSEAALRVAMRLRKPWAWLAAFRCLPVSWRDRVYDFVARHRFRWFGRHDTCWMPRPEWRDRFLD